MGGGVIRRGRVTLPALWRHSRRSRLASLNAGSLPMPSNSQQEASTCRSHDFCGPAAAAASHDLNYSPFTLLITTPTRIISGSYIRGEEGRLMRGRTL
ncbi:hypothetical protein E2C01_049494 [Portunus trituberculatus]|uniref:Uncharacterized protein n=1 Tax=Portunus trituberculatus TaxID=210409 RepID=A0A5B7GE35_PORTR|nr:hypothetical protein [Portunus trituberculatus]